MRFRHAVLLLAVIGSIALGLPGAARAQVGNGISSPADGSIVQGAVPVVGTATLPDFLRYELYFSANEQDWVYFSGGDVAIIGGVLGYWDTLGAGLPDGRYTLRMRVVRLDSNYDEYYVRNLVVSNSAPPTEAPTATPLEQPATPTPLPADNTPSGTVVVTVELPPTSTPVAATPTRRASQSATPEGFLPLGEISLTGAGGAFMRGVYITAGIFLVIGGYVFLRNGTFWIMRRMRLLLHRRRARGGSGR